MATDKKTIANIHENGKSAYAVDISVSGFDILGDEPVSFGGGNLGPAPYDLLTAALGECTAMTIRYYAKQKDWPVEKVEVSVTHTKIDKTDHFHKEIKIHGAALSQEQHDKLIEISAKCPVQRTLEGTPQMSTALLN